MSSQPRKKLTAEEKRDIVLHSFRQDMTQSELCRHYGIYPVDLLRWKERFLEQGIEGLKDKRKSKKSVDQEQYDKLLKEKSELERALVDQTVELQLLKKKVG
jgi:transposase-like protein